MRVCVAWRLASASCVCNLTDNGRHPRTVFFCCKTPIAASNNSIIQRWVLRQMSPQWRPSVARFTLWRNEPKKLQKTGLTYLKLQHSMWIQLLPSPAIHEIKKKITRKLMNPLVLTPLAESWFPTKRPGYNEDSNRVVKWSHHKTEFFWNYGFSSISEQFLTARNTNFADVPSPWSSKGLSRGWNGCLLWQ